jgi:parallel beta-helix repeat protein
MRGKKSFLVALIALIIITTTSNVAYALTEIDSCQSLGIAGEYYVLNQSITGSITVDCISIEAANVVFDCDGYYIRNTTAAYSGVISDVTNSTIKNCNITMESTWQGVGIRLVGADNSYILNNTLNSQGYGLLLTATDNTRIENNTANYNNEAGITLQTSSTSNVIINNTASYSLGGGESGHGIQILSSSLNNVTDNTANSNFFNGIILGNSANNNIVANNTLNSNNNIGIALWANSGNVLTNNNIWDCGTTSSGCINVGNNVDGTTVTGGIINLSSNYLIYIGTDSNNNVFQDIRLYNTGGASGDNAIHVLSSDNTFDNLTIYDPGSANSGIYSTSDYMTVTNCNITMANTVGGTGIEFAGSDFSTVKNNTLSNNYYGIYASGADDTVYDNNTASSNSKTGIFVTASSGSNLTNNTANANNVEEAGYGIHLSATTSNLVSNNTMKSNSDAGLYLESSSSNTLTDNFVKSNNLLGILLGSSSNSNSFTDNKIHSNPGYAIDLIISNYNIFIGNSIWNCSSGGGFACIFVYESDYSVFDRNQINQSSNYGISIQSSGSGDTSSHNIFKNSNMTNVVGTGVYMDDNAGSSNLNNTFLNFTYNNESVDISSSELLRKWYLDVFVMDSNGRSISNADVSLFNKSGEFYDASTTNAGGRTKSFEAVKYVNKGGTITEHNNHTLSATHVLSKTGAVAAIVNVTTNMLVNITMDIFYTIQITLTLDNLANDVYIPGTGPVQSASIVNGSYNNPTHWYLASYSNNTLNALIFNYQTPEILWVNRTSDQHTFTLSKKVQNSKSLLVFTSGDWKTVDNRIELIENGDFFTKISPSFAHGLGINYLIKILLSYSNIDITDDLIMQSGTHNIVAENTGRSGSQRLLRIRSV